VVPRGELLPPSALSGTGEASLVARAEVVPTSALLASGEASRVAPNILSIAHWERLLGGELYAPLSRLDWATLLRRTFEVDVKSWAHAGADSRTKNHRRGKFHATRFPCGRPADHGDANHRLSTRSRARRVSTTSGGASRRRAACAGCTRRCRTGQNLRAARGGGGRCRQASPEARPRGCEAATATRPAEVLVPRGCSRSRRAPRRAAAPRPV
jgi:hypothetical protein